jgi:hypothetical protein
MFAEVLHAAGLIERVVVATYLLEAAHINFVCTNSWTPKSESSSP